MSDLDTEAIKARLAAGVNTTEALFENVMKSIRGVGIVLPFAQAHVIAASMNDLRHPYEADIAALLAEVERLRACCERLLVESARLRVLEHAVRAGGACSENVMSARAAIAAMGAVALPEKATPSMRHAAAIEEQRVVAGEANTERYARLWRAMLAAWREETGR